MKAKALLKQIGLMILISILIFTIVMLSLRWFTRHNQSYIAPDLSGLTMDHLKKLETEYGFQFIIIDSVYEKDLQPGTVLRHDPAPNSTVKKGRKFYLTTVASAPGEVAMPNLIDFSLRQAKAILESYGLVLGAITYRPDFSQNAVIEQLMEGEPIEAGKRIRKGSKIDLVVSGSGDTHEISSDEMNFADSTLNENEDVEIELDEI